MPSSPSSPRRWIDQMLKTHPPRGKSLLVTLLGDAIAPRGGSVWMVHLIEMAAQLGLNERLVRTSASRLVTEGWLLAERSGRESVYTLTETGTQRFTHAFRRIYDELPSAWDGHWTLLIEHTPFAARHALRQKLEWEGFGRLAPGIYTHPLASRAALSEILTRLRAESSVAVFEAGELGSMMTQLAPRCWPLEAITEQHRAFIALFLPIHSLLTAQTKNRHSCDPVEAFQLRTLLIHSYRRIGLHDPRLPPALLPQDWLGYRAWGICRDLYYALWEASESYLDTQLAEKNVQPIPSQRKPGIPVPRHPSTLRFGGNGQWPPPRHRAGCSDDVGSSE